mgnify:FL=1
MSNDPACESILENGVENDAQIFIDAPLDGVHDIADVNGLDTDNRHIAEDGK